MPEIIVIAHNIRSTYNVGSIFRTCEGFGAKKLILTGYTPDPAQPVPSTATTRSYPVDGRLPHIVLKLTKEIHKTALDAEKMVPFIYSETPPLTELRADGYYIVGLEQAEDSTALSRFEPPEKVALLLGEEVQGIPDELLAQCDETIEIPMLGKKESFNVSVATGIALYALTT